MGQPHKGPREYFQSSVSNDEMSFKEGSGEGGYKWGLYEVMQSFILATH